jgi:branched-chain amino acid transport system substrate-binding protein
MAGRAVYPSTDLYSLGVTALVLLTGKLNPIELFDAYTNRWQWHPFVTVSSRLTAVLERLLDPTPNQRFQSAAEVLAALNPGQTSVSAPPMNSYPAPSSLPAVAAPSPVAVPLPAVVSAEIPATVGSSSGSTGGMPSSPSQPQGGGLPLNLGKIALGILVFLGLLGGALWVTSQFMGNKTQSTGQTETLNSSQSERLSTGEVLLIAENSTPQKQEAVAAIAKGEYDTAISALEASLQKQPNDPETLIYLNNARIGKEKSYTIAISIPYSAKDEGTKGAAKEMLRGIAQAQKEVNEAGGINGTPLRVAVVTETNEPDSTEKAAQLLVKQPDILAVIGHFGSGASLAAAKIYEQEKLVMISPTSTSTELSQSGQYIFRTVPSDNFTGKALARYMVENLKKQKAAVFFNGENGYSKSLRDVFTESLFSNDGEVIGEFDLNEPNFKAEEVYQQAQQRGAEVIVLLPNSATLPQTFAVIKANRGRLPLLGGDSPYRSTTLQEGGTAAKGMVLAVPWHIAADRTTNFPKMARQLWGGDVSWRTAMTYDATQALIQALKEAQDRPGIQAALANPRFSAPGASGTVRFLRSGDRNQRTQLVQIVTAKAGDEFPVVFAPLP